MKKITGEKKVGFYLMCAAAVLSLISMVIYRTVLSQMKIVYGLSIIPAIITILIVVIVKALGEKEVLNWAAAVNAVITALTAIISCSIMLDAFGYVVSGLYQFSQIRSYVIYAVVVVIAMILNVAAGFTGIVGESQE